MNYKYILSRDLAIVFATLFLGSSFLLKMLNSANIASVYAMITLGLTLVSIVFMVIFRNKE